MSFRDFIVIYAEVGLALAIIEPLLWYILSPRNWNDLMSRFKGNAHYDCGFAFGMIIGSVIGWPIHLVTWYILDPLRAKKKTEKES